MKIELGSPGTAEPTFPDCGTRREGRQTAAFAATRFCFLPDSTENVSRSFLEARQVAAVFLFLQEEADAPARLPLGAVRLSRVNISGLNFVSRERPCYRYLCSVELAVFRFTQNGS